MSPHLAGPARRGAEHLRWWRRRSTTCGHELVRARSLFSSGSRLTVMRVCHNDKNQTCTPVSCANFTKQKLPDHSRLHLPPSHVRNRSHTCIVELQKQWPTRFALQHGIASDKQDAHLLWQHFLMTFHHVTVKAGRSVA